MLWHDVYHVGKVNCVCSSIRLLCGFCAQIFHCLIFFFWSRHHCYIDKINSSLIRSFLTYNPLEDRHIDVLTIGHIFLLYNIKQIEIRHSFMSCSNRLQKKDVNTVRESATHLAAPCAPLFCYNHIWTSSVIYYRIDRWQHGIYLFNCWHALKSFWPLLKMSTCNNGLDWILLLEDYTR